MIRPLSVFGTSKPLTTAEPTYTTVSYATGKFSNGIVGNDGIFNSAVINQSITMISPPITFDFWITPTDLSTPVAPTFISCMNDPRPPYGPFTVSRLTTGSIVVQCHRNTGIVYLSYTHDDFKMTEGVAVHFALVFNTSTRQIYVNGTLEAEDSSGGLNVPANGSVIYLSNPYAVVDELRISNTARWTSGFTPPSSPYTTDGSTLGLWHFNDTLTATTGNDAELRIIP